MQVPALKNTDIWFHRLMQETKRGEIEGESLVRVPVQDTVRVDRVLLKHDGEDVKNRPYLEISGILVSSVPEIQLPYGVNEITFSQSPSTYMSYRYDFTREQLADLVMRGLYEKDFEVPEEMIGIEWELPGQSDFLIVSPLEFSDPPIVLATIHDQNEHVIDMDSSGYDLVEYFPNLHLEAEQEVEVTPQTEVEDEVEVVLEDDLFAEENKHVESAKSLDVPVLTTDVEDSAEAKRVESATIFDRMVAEARERLEKREQAARQAEEGETGAEVDEPQSELSEAEKLYRDRIAKEVEEARNRPTSLSIDPTEPELDADMREVLDEIDEEVDATEDEDEDVVEISEEDKLEAKAEAQNKARSKAQAVIDHQEENVEDDLPVNENGELDLD